MGSGARRAVRRARAAVAQQQRRAARALGVSWGHRTDTVVAMLANNARRAPGYWIQLVLAMGIATFGLVLGSTAVVIGAMLVSPLMGPIVELGMGFAVGSSLLVLRSALRVLLSIAAVVAGAAFITLSLPFHEVTSEIAARTAPTALDLLVAVFCALTAAYTTVRAAADTTAAAAGTAIGIALVPPLCVVGYGLGTRAPEVAAGAALLFTANFSAIVVFAVLAFLLLGYNWVDAARLEREYLARDRSDTERAAERAHRALQRAFGSRYGLVMRVGVPALFLGAVYVPLRRALDEVAWQVRERAAIRRALAELAPGAVQTNVRVERGRVALHLLLPGTLDDANRVERRLVPRLAAEGADELDVRVTAVADARALAAAVLRAQRAEPPAPEPPAQALRARLDARLAERWPAAAAGPLLHWTAETPPSGPVLVTIRHLGAPLGAAAEQLLAEDIAAALGTAVRLTAAALPPEPLVGAPGDERAWFARVTPLFDAIAATPSAVACVTRPPTPRGARAVRAAAAIRRALDSSAVSRTGQLRLAQGPAWTARAASGACPADAAADTLVWAAGRPPSGADP